MELNSTRPACSEKPITFFQKHAKLKLFMRVGLFYIFFAVLSLQLLKAHTVKSQTLDSIQVTVELRKENLKKLFKKIEQQTNLMFAYQPPQVDAYDQISIPRVTRSVKETLDEAFKGTSLGYRQLNNSVLIYDRSDQAEEVKSHTMVVVITGTIRDEEGNPIPGANIIIKGTTQGTTSDVDGRYSLEVVDEDAVLIFSFIGYTSQEVHLNGRSVVDVTLMQDYRSLEEVVVVGYGTQRSRDLTTAVAKLSSDKLADRTGVVTRVDQALVGALAGVRVQEISGQPGRPLSVQVRGLGTITAGSEPLYVIDGVPISGSLDNIAIGNIESIEVLKDAAAAAIYGSRGANGIVLITTKKGKEGKPVVSVKSRFGFQKVAETYDVMKRDEWIDFAVEERTNSYLLAGGDLNVPQDARPGGYRINPEWITNPEKFPDTDWQGLISRTAPIHNSQIAVSGGSDKTTYSLYADVFQQEGVIKYTDYNRYSFKSQVETQVSERVKFGLSMSPSFSVQNEADAENVGGPIARAKFLAPIAESHLGTVETGGEPYTRTDILVNPLAWLKETDDETKRFRTIGNIFGEVKILENLTVRNTTSIDYSTSKTNFYKTNNVNRDNGSFGQTSTGLSTNLLNETLLNYTFTSDRHYFTGLAGFSAQKFYSESTSNHVTGFPDDLVKTLNAGTELISASSSASAHNLLSYFSRVTYSFDDRYLFTASIRRDGSSRFGPNNKWGWFPSGSVGWRISSEDFMDDISIVNDLKLRASYGVTGNYNIPNYGYIGGLAQRNYVFGSGAGALAAGLSPSTFSNPDLSWEKNRTLNLGFDLGIMEDRFTLVVDAYRSTTNDLLLNVPIPVISGFDNSLRNIGSVENRGIEIEVGGDVITSRKFSWHIDGNISFNRNKVLELGPEGTPIFGFARGTSVAITEIGSPIGSYYLIPVEGVFMSEEELNSSPLSKVQSVGDLKYTDSNKDGIITDADKVIVGKNQPDYIWGISQTFRFGNFDLSALIYGEAGNHLLNESQGGAGRSHVGNVLGYWRNRFVSPEDPGDGKTPRAAVTANLTTPSTFWLFDASFWRVRNVSLGYTAPYAWLEKGNHGISGMRVYLSAENIFTRDHYFGTPQTGTQSNNPLVPGIDATNTYPLAKSLVLGLNLTF